MNTKRLLLMAFGLLGMTVLGVAQDIKVPAWEKFVCITKENVSLRKAPNAQSARLYSRGERIHRWDAIEYSWVAKNGFTPYYLSTTATMPVIKEVNGWYLLYLNKDVEVYVPQNLCEVVEPSHFETGQDFYSNGVELGKVRGNNNYYVTCYDDTGNWSDHFVFIGEKFGLGILWRDYGKESVEFAKRQCGATEWAHWYDIKKMEGLDIARFIRSHNPKTYIISYRFLNNVLNDYEYDPATYKHKMVSEPETYRVTKFVGQETGKKMSVYKSPSLTAPRVIFLGNPEEDEGGDGIGGSWTWDDRRYSRSLVSKEDFSILPVVGEENGWYRVYASVGGGFASMQHFIGYTPKQGCKDLTATNASLLDLTEGELLADGKHHIEYGMMDFLFGTYLRISTVENGLIKTTEWIPYQEDAARKCIKIQKGKKEYTLRGNNYFNNATERPLVDLRRLTNYDIGRILNLVDNKFEDTTIKLNNGDLYVFKSTIINGREVILGI